MDLKQDLGNVVRQRRLDLGLSQIELADLMANGTRQSDISRIERGYIPWPRPDLLSDLAAALKMHPLELITQAGWMTQQECQHFMNTHHSIQIKPLVLLGINRAHTAFAAEITLRIGSGFRTLMAFDGETVLETVISQKPVLAIIQQDCTGLDFDELETTIQQYDLDLDIVVIGSDRTRVPRDLRFHYLKTPVSGVAIDSLLDAMGYQKPVSA